MTRDSTPHKARKSNEGTVEVRGGGEVGGGAGTYAHTSHYLCIYHFAFDGLGGGQV